VSSNRAGVTTRIRLLWPVSRPNWLMPLGANADFRRAADLLIVVLGIRGHLNV
jgi:hypothetical protein